MAEVAEVAEVAEIRPTVCNLHVLAVAYEFNLWSIRHDAGRKAHFVRWPRFGLPVAAFWSAERQFCLQNANNLANGRGFLVWYCCRFDKKLKIQKIQKMGPNMP